MSRFRRPSAPTEYLSAPSFRSPWTETPRGVRLLAQLFRLCPRSPTPWDAMVRGRPLDASGLRAVPTCAGLPPATARPCWHGGRRLALSDDAGRVPLSPRRPYEVLEHPPRSHPLPGGSWPFPHHPSWDMPSHLHSSREREQPWRPRHSRPLVDPAAARHVPSASRARRPCPRRLLPFFLPRAVASAPCRRRQTAPLQAPRSRRRNSPVAQCPCVSTFLELAVRDMLPSSPPSLQKCLGSLRSPSPGLGSGAPASCLDGSPRHGRPAHVGRLRCW